MSGWRRWDKLEDFARGLSLAGFVAFSASSLLPVPSLPFEPTASLLPDVAAEAELASVPAAAKLREAPDRAATLDRGETLGQVLGELGLAATEVAGVAEVTGRFVDPRQLRPGLRVAAFVDGEVPSRFELALEGKGELTVVRTASGWDGSFRAYAREARPRVVRGLLEGSLERSLVRAGGPAELAYAMADVLQWDLDFARDLQNGDQFEALFEEIYLEGRPAGLGRVLAVTYSQSRRKLEAFRYGAGESFYDAEGRPLEKMFLRAPLPYSRVTSKFSMRRFHPVLKIARPHYGVDYGAPVGTPVRVTASGTVQSAGWDGGGGKTVKVRHANGYLTGYLHLSRFASGVRAGARVRQGEIIGYVGSTGLSSGPHLDYRVQHHGKWIDPQSLVSVPAEPLTAVARAGFDRELAAMRDALAGLAPYAPPAPAAPEPAATVLAQGGAPAPQSPLATKK